MKLKPCPFCGVVPHIEKNEYGDYRVFANHKCEYEPGMNEWFETEYEAVDE